MSATSPIGILTTDINLNVTSWNDWLADNTGLTEKVVLGQPLTTVIPDLEERGLYDRFLSVLTNGSVEILAPVFHHYLIRIPLNEPEGRYTEMQQRVTIAPLAEDGTVHGTLVTIENATIGMVEEREDFPSKEKLAELSSEDWKKRKDVAGSLATAGRTIISEVLRKIRLEHRNLSILSSAMQVISLSREDVSDYLMEFLADEDHELRIYSAQMLAEQNSPAVIEVLMRALDDSDANVRYHAIESLGKLRAFQAVERLAEIALSRDFFTAFPAIDSLRLIGDNRAARLIHPLLNDDMLGQPAIEAVGELGEADIVPGIVSLINSNSSLLPYLVMALARISARYQETLGDGGYIADIARKEFNRNGVSNLLSYIENITDMKELNTVVPVLGWLDDDNISLALTGLMGNPDIRKQVIDALVASGPKVLDLLISQLDNDAEIRQSAVLALGRIGGEKAVDALLPLLTDDDVAVICCGALAKIGSSRAFRDLIGLLGHPDASIRRASIAALNSIGHPEMEKSILHLLCDRDPHVRESAVRIAGYFGYSSCRTFVHRLCSDVNLDVQIAAIESLPAYEDERLFEALQRIYNGENTRIRTAVVKSLGQMDSKESYGILSLALADNDQWVRYYAVKSASMHGFVELIPQIKEMAMNDPAPFVKLAAIDFLGHTGGHVSASILASLTGDKNIEIALAAVSALGDVHHPDSLPTLLALSKTSDPDMKRVAIESLGRRGGTGTAGALQWVAITEKDPVIRNSVVNSLKLISTRESISALLNLTSDTENRERAINALAGLPVEMMQIVCEGLYHKNTLVRTAVVEVLLRMRSPLTSAELAHCLNHKDPNVRLATVNALNRLGNRKYMKKLLELKNIDPDPAIRKAVEDIISVNSPVI